MVMFFCYRITSFNLLSKRAYCLPQGDNNYSRPVVDISEFSGSTDDPEFFIWGDWGTSETDVARELKTCVDAFGLGNSVEFHRSYKP